MHIFAQLAKVFDTEFTFALWLLFHLSGVLSNVKAAWIKTAFFKK